MDHSSELRKLAQFVHELTWKEIPAQVRCAVVDRVLDLVSVAAGASRDSLIGQVADSYERRKLL